MKHYAIIPARCGSKRVKNKNLIRLNKESITEKAIRKADQSKIFEKIYLSTDIPYFIDHFASSAVPILHYRPLNLALDDTLMRDVVLEVIRTYDFEETSYVWVLQPTTPFRDDYQFKEIRDIVKKNKPASVISVKNVGSFHPNRMYTINHGELKPLRHTNFINSQNLPDIWIRNGGYYVVRVKDFLKTKDFHCSPCFAYTMHDGASINIDTPMDVLYAKTYSEHTE